tara:strand:- start:436 stop:543 length:108 start_codon:yes stop_codon:yes gene_type:complete
MVSAAVKATGSIIKLINPKKGAIYDLRNFSMELKL